MKKLLAIFAMVVMLAIPTFAQGVVRNSNVGDGGGGSSSSCLYNGTLYPRGYYIPVSNTIYSFYIPSYPGSFMPETKHWFWCGLATPGYLDGNAHWFMYCDSQQVDPDTYGYTFGGYNIYCPHL